MRYQRVYTAFWRETRTWPEDDQKCALYLLTCEHRRTEGLFVLPPAYAAHDLGWSAARTTGAIEALVLRGWAMTDGEWLLIVNALRHDQPNKGNQTTAAVTAVDTISRASPLYARFYAEAVEHSAGFAAALDRPSGASTSAEIRLSPGSTHSDSDSVRDRDRDSDRQGAAALVVVPPHVPEAEEIEKACDVLAEADVRVHDRSTVTRLAAEFPEVDVVAAAIRAANWARGKGVDHPLGLLRRFVEAKDAPKRRVVSPKPGIYGRNAIVDRSGVRE